MSRSVSAFGNISPQNNIKLLDDFLGRTLFDVEKCRILHDLGGFIDIMQIVSKEQLDEFEDWLNNCLIRIQICMFLLQI